MRTMTSSCFRLLLGATALACASAADAQQRDPRLGSWVEQRGQGSVGLRTSYEDLGDGRIRILLSGLMVDARCDGESYPFVGRNGQAAGPLYACRITGPRTVEYTYTQPGREPWSTSTGVETLSADGQTLLHEGVRLDANGAYVEDRNITFLRQAATPVSATQARWTPAAEAPAGVLAHALEGQRHDRFIELAQQGGINLVFFGTTEAEMWWWPDRGRSVWDREFGSLGAANFGSQGTHLESLVWRMQNGELDGFDARLIVLQAGLQSGANRTPEGMTAGYEAVLNEIRLRQPRARVLLFAPLPRDGNLETWRQRAQEMEAEHAGLVDGETVYYTDIGDRFFDESGWFKAETWSVDPANRGTQTGAFEIWAEAMQPWIDRFLR